MSASSARSIHLLVRAADIHIELGMRPTCFAESSHAPLLDLLVLVLSSDTPGGVERREGVRAAWGSSLSRTCRTRIFFVLGANTTDTASIGSAMHSTRVLEDCVHTPVPERYNLISLKVLVALQWGASQWPSRYVLKADDDTYVCPGGILQLLHRLPRTQAWHKEPSKSLLLALRVRPCGCARFLAAPQVYAGLLRQSGSFTLHALDNAAMNKSQWYDPMYSTLFNTSIYPPYMQGGGYILSHDLVATVIVEARTRFAVADLASSYSGLLSRVSTVEDALVGALLFYARSGTSISELRYYDLSRVMHSWARVADALGVDESAVCDICASADVLVVHPLKLAGRQARCAACARRRKGFTACQPAADGVAASTQRHLRVAVLRADYGRGPRARLEPAPHAIGNEQGIVWY
jgi:hypothetical protein